jgi:hypothetical protein
VTGLANEKDMIQTFSEWITAFIVHNIFKMVALLADDVKISSIIFGIYKGREGASKYWQELYNVFHDTNVNLVTITADE